MQLGKVRVAQQFVKARGRWSTSKQHGQSAPGVGGCGRERSGWKVVQVYQDAGISGAKGRDQRPGLDAMMKAVNAREFDIVVDLRRYE
jgi:DNA invertase Pin-like site-specific DNA recombinase